MAKKMALGKGIASLIKETPNEILSKSLREEETTLEEAGSSSFSHDGVAMISVSEIIRNPNQPRKMFKEKELEELSQSIIENGVIQPLIICKSSNGTGFDLIAGERRLRASEMAGLEKVPVVIKRATDKEKMVMSIIENVQRSDLNCIEEALAYFKLLDEFNLTQEEVAKKLGKERSSIANYLRILKLPRPVIDALQKEKLSFGHAKVLAALNEKEKMIRFCNEAVLNGYSVRELEKKIKSKAVSSEKKENKFYLDEKIEGLKDKLEKKTGHHFKISSKSNGSGEFGIKFSNEAEFNDIFEFLMTRN